VAVNFISGKWNTRWKPPTCCKSLSNNSNYNTKQRRPISNN